MTAGAIRRDFITVLDMKVEVERMGKGKPVLVLSGEEQLEQASAALADLAKDHELIFVSPPGFGRSERPDWISGPEDLSFILMDVLSALNLGPVPVIGFSLGGWLIAEIATKDDRFFSKLVFVNSYGVKIGGPFDRDINDIWTTHADKVAKWKWHDVEKGKRDFPSMAEDDLKIVARNVESTARFCWQPYMHNPKLTKRIHRIKTPSLFVWGENDGITPVTYGRAYSQLIAGSKFAAIPNAGHFPHIEQPEAFLKSVRSFLA